jgi:hypothetical protein
MRRSLVCLGVVAAVSLGVAPTPAAAQTVRGCKNPAGQIRIVSDAESCRSQETFVSWFSGGVTGGGDQGGQTAAFSGAVLSNDNAVLTTENIATGFPGYMVWATVAVELFGPVTAGAPVSPSNPGCRIVFSVNGQGSYLADARGVAFPTNTLTPPPTVPPNGIGRFVRLNIGLSAFIAGYGPPESRTPLTPSDVLDVTLECNTPGPGNGTALNPPPNPVRVPNWTLSGIGIDQGFPILQP